MPFAQAARPTGADMRIVGRLDWGTLARIHLLDDRQYRDAQACPLPGRGGSNTVALAQCPALADPARTLLGAEQERWLADGWDLARPWNLVGQQTLMARMNWQDPAQGGVYWTDGWDGYAPARKRLLGTVAAKKVPGVVVLGGDVHSNYVADLKADYDDPAAAVVASEFCGTSITSLSLPQARIDAALAFNPHIRYARTDQRGYVSFELDASQLRAALQVVDRPLDPESGVTTAARFVVDAGQARARSPPESAAAPLAPPYTPRSRGRPLTSPERRRRFVGSSTRRGADPTTPRRKSHAEDRCRPVRLAARGQRQRPSRS